MSLSAPALEIGDLTVSFRVGERWLDAVRDVSLRIEAGQTYGLVGESGSGKSTLVLAVMRYLGENGAIRRGTIKLGGQDLSRLDDPALRRVWREQVRLVPQNPLSSLNPSLRVGDQIGEALGPELDRRHAQERVLELLSQVRLSDPERVALSYPHQLSGGMQQRIMIAMALSGDPALLVLDEPTTNLDVTTEAVILDLIRDLIRARRSAVLYVSHNLGVIAGICDRVAVLYAGELVEDAAVEELYARPLHPYTQGLLDSVPRLGQNRGHAPVRPIPGSIPPLDNLPPGCIFAPRCHLATEFTMGVRPPLDTPHSGRRVRCHRWPEILGGTANSHQPAPPPLAEHAAREPVDLLQVQDVTKSFPLNRSLLQTLKGQPSRKVHAVDCVSFALRQRRILGLVGESGSGKSTLARCIVGLTPATSGELRLLDMPLARDLERRDRDALRRIQMVFQNPEEALNPFLTIGETLRYPLVHLGGCPPHQAHAAVVKLLEAVKLPASFASRLPGRLSGGEKQRVAIARAFASNPDLLLLDEPVSALDVSVQATVLSLLDELEQTHGTSLLFISHDLAVVSYLAEEIAVMYLGRLMEVGPTREILTPPHHPYTEALLSSIPVIEPSARHLPIRLTGEPPSPVNVPGGCPFHTRCPRFLGDICVRQEPPWQAGENGHRIYCHIPLDELQRLQFAPTS